MRARAHAHAQALTFVYLSWEDAGARSTVEANRIRLRNASETCKQQCQLCAAGRHAWLLPHARGPAAAPASSGMPACSDAPNVCRWRHT
jgi:hypothetical protein